MQCRITTEDPENHFIPDYGRISAYREATGFGIRLDGGTAYSSAVITPFYDSLLEKVTAWAPSHEECIRRMDRALREFRIRGVKTNLPFLEALITHPSFRAGDYTTRFVDETPELFRFRPRRDRATRLLSFVADVLVNGNPEAVDRPVPTHMPVPQIPAVAPRPEEPTGSRDRLRELGPAGFASWMRAQERLLVTDTTFRDAHQSLLATRFRTHDLLGPAAYYARHLPGLLSLEAWGGATFDVAMRFLKEDPWDRLAQLREAVPNLLLRCCCGPRTRSATPTTRTTSSATSWPRRPTPASTSSASSTASTGSRTCASRWTRCSSRGCSWRRPSATRATSPTRRATSTTSPTTWTWPGSSRRPAPTCSASRTWRGSASPRPPACS